MTTLGPDDATPIVCCVCNGQFERLEETGRGHRMVRCRWCLRGAMTEAMLRRWQEWRDKQRKP